MSERAKLAETFERPADHDERVKQARARAQWELGYPSWADVILGAYMHPEQDREDLEAVRDE